MQAEAQNDSSWFWKGLLQTRETIRKGMCYQVHKGHSIRIWEDHVHHSFRPVAREGTEPPGHILHVSDLINPEARQWDEALIRSIFDDQTGQAILNIHLSQTPLEDKIIWQPDGKGQFSTKSAYLTNNSVNFQDTGPLSTRQWNKLWSSNIQERLKTNIPMANCMGRITSESKIGKLPSTGE